MYFVKESSRLATISHISDMWRIQKIVQTQRVTNTCMIFLQNILSGKFRRDCSFLGNFTVNGPFSPLVIDGLGSAPWPALRGPSRCGKFYRNSWSLFVVNKNFFIDSCMVITSKHMIEWNCFMLNTATSLIKEGVQTFAIKILRLFLFSLKPFHYLFVCLFIISHWG